MIPQLICSRLENLTNTEPMAGAFIAGKGNRVWLCSGAFNEHQLEIDLDSKTLTSVKVFQHMLSISYCLLPDGTWILGGGEELDTDPYAEVRRHIHHPFSTMKRLSLDPFNIRNVRTTGDVPEDSCSCKMKYLGINSDGHDLVILFGGCVAIGFRHKFNPCSNRVHVLNVNTLVWENVSSDDSLPAPEPRCLGEMIVVDENTIVIVGGEDYNKKYDDVWMSSLNSRQWQKLSSSNKLSPSPRSQFVAALHHRWIVIVGGVFSTKSAPLADSWAFNLDSCEWTQISIVGDEFPACVGHVWMALPSGLFFTVGGEVEPYSSWNKNFYEFSFNTGLGVKNSRSTQ